MKTSLEMTETAAATIAAVDCPGFEAYGPPLQGLDFLDAPPPRVQASAQSEGAGCTFQCFDNCAPSQQHGEPGEQYMGCLNACPPVGLLQSSAAVSTLRLEGSFSLQNGVDDELEEEEEEEGDEITSPFHDNKRAVGNHVFPWMKESRQNSKVKRSPPPTAHRPTVNGACKSCDFMIYCG